MAIVGIRNKYSVYFVIAGGYEGKNDIAMQCRLFAATPCGGLQLADRLVQSVAVGEQHYFVLYK